MKQFILAITLGAMIFISFSNLKAGVFKTLSGGDPHDSLLYDGGLESIEIPVTFKGFDDCSIRVTKVKGKVIGKVFQAFIEAKGCEAGFDTIYREVERQVKVGDILVGGGNIETGDDGYVEIGYFTSADLLKKNFPAMTNKINKNTKIEVPYISELCMEIEYQKDQASKQEIKIIEGVVTYEAEDDDQLTPLPKIKTKGKKATVKHKNTMYTHEVRVEGNDTIDIVNVYKGSVEVLYLNPDFSGFENTAEEMEKLSKDFAEGKITMEEFSAKMNEFTNISQEISKFTEPVIVEEGNKCIINNNKITVEPGTDSVHWWEE